MTEEAEVSEVCLKWLEDRMQKLTPEQTLLFALLKNTIRDTYRPITCGESEQELRRIKSQARHWLFEDERPGVPGNYFTLKDVCTHLDIDMSYLRRKLKEGNYNSIFNGERCT